MKSCRDPRTLFSVRGDIARLVAFYVILAAYWVVSSAYAAQPEPESSTIAIVHSHSVAAYHEAILGFLHELRRNFVPRFNTLIYDNLEGFYEKLQQNKKQQGQAGVDLIVTIGTHATLDISYNIHDIPIVFSMVLDPERILEQHENIVGASLNIPAELQLKMIKEVLPNVEKIGVIYDPTRNADTVNHITELASKFRLRIKSFPVTSQKDIPKALSKVQSETDALLGIVDNTVYTSRTTQFIIRYTVKKQLPFIGISPSYVKAGALCALVFDSKDIGRQSAQLAERILSGIPVSELQNTIPEKIHIALNLRTADIIGVNIPKKIQERASIVYE